MGLLERFRRLRGRVADDASAPAIRQTRRFYGNQDLELVGESFYQPALWNACGGTIGGERVRHEVVAVLVPESDNLHDRNAVAAHIDGKIVGHLDRETAAQYVAGVHALMHVHNAHVELNGVIVGGGWYGDRPGLLGVWLDHDPADFGIAPPSYGAIRAARSGNDGVMRTGFSEAWLTDAEDDSYDLSWYDELPERDVDAIAKLRQLLETDPDPIDRHFQFAELEARLYRMREAGAFALDEYDDVCGRHDLEMDGICAAFVRKWDRVPLLETYRQMAVRQAKKKDWRVCLWWAERGLALYGDRPARREAVDDLVKRRDRAATKLEPAEPRSTNIRASVVPVQRPPVSASSSAEVARVGAVDVEVLSCGQCLGPFERLRVRGRKPRLCPECRLG